MSPSSDIRSVEEVAATMPRNTCPACRAENLVSAVICVACGAIFQDRGAAAASSTVTTEEPWTPPMPVRAVAERSHRPALSIARDRPQERIPPRPD